MSDPRYRHPVAGLGEEELSARLREAIADVQGIFPPSTGVCVFVFDFGGGPATGLGYIANADRADMAKALREWLAKEASNS